MENLPLSPVPPAPDGDEGLIEICNYFVRERNALLVRGSFGPLYMDYYLHLMQHEMKPEPQHDVLFKEALAAFTLYVASRPWKEITAWTANLQNPLLNIFLTGNSTAGTITGRVFADSVKKQSTGQLYSQVIEQDKESRTSIIDIEGNDFFTIAKNFHAQSDQRPARFFEIRPEEYVLIAAQPDCDLEWLAALDSAKIANLETSGETLTHLETRRYRFHCGCEAARFIPSLTSLSTAELDDLFTKGDPLTIQCPRCGASIPISRSDIESFSA